MDSPLPQRRRERAAGLERLRAYTRRIIFASGALVVALSVLAAQSIPGKAAQPAAGGTAPGAATGQDGQQPGQPGQPGQAGQQQFTQPGQGSSGGVFFGGGGGGPITVTGGS